jgi:ribulose-5-phosphate 4-epimerase/fuculose-1-phosphate aldolase
MLKAYQKLTHTIVNLVNAPRGQSYEQTGSKYWLKASQKQQLIEAGRLIVEQKLAQSTWGEVSLRLASHQLAITVRQSLLTRLEDNHDFITCSIAADKPVDQAPLHLDWHRLLYRETEANGVVFCQPPYTLTLANAGRLPQPHIAPELYQTIGGVICLPPDEFTNEQLTEAARQHHALVLPRVGTLVWGLSPLEAVARTEALEYISYLTILIRDWELSDSK